MHEVLLELWQTEGMRTVFMITHDVDEAITLADRILLVKNGTLATDIRVSLPRPRTTEDITGETASEIRRLVLQEFAR
jgi:ABC-type nitrate/sulfonate/bicarbonate transport system ATPase subunit